MIKKVVVNNDARLVNQDDAKGRVAKAAGYVARFRATVHIQGYLMIRRRYPGKRHAAPTAADGSVQMANEYVSYPRFVALERRIEVRSVAQGIAIHGRYADGKWRVMHRQEYRLFACAS